MADEQDEQDMAPRATFARVVSLLPPPGTVEYWQQIEHAPQDEPLQITDRAVRKILNRVFADLRARYQEE